MFGSFSFDAYNPFLFLMTFDMFLYRLDLWVWLNLSVLNHINALNLVGYQNSTSVVAQYELIIQ